MKQVIIFPGQGSQYRGMGEGLFGKFPELVESADAQLGYSIEELCLKDPKRLLNKTEHTQPALYTVNALTYLDMLGKTGRTPDYVAGHSLGEYNALFAAGAFDFLTGLKLVQKRGLLMSQAPRGAMAAILDIDQARVREILDGLPYRNIDIANINSQKQCIISGLFDEVYAVEKTFLEAGANFIPLNVSAAFHSRCMYGVQLQFEEFLSGFELQPLQLPVVANYTARPYQPRNYADYLVQQISNPVRWYESVSWLLKKANPVFEELGPGDVLTKMVSYIKDAPLDISDDPVAEPGVPTGVVGTPELAEENKLKLIFMYSGQGSQYYQMGRELYEKNSTFRKHMDYCSGRLEPLLNRNLVDIIYDDSRKVQEFDEILYTHPALYSFGYSLTQVLIEKGIEPDAVLGHSLGEYIAATVAGALPLDDGLELVFRQAQYLQQSCPAGGLLNVFEGVDLFHNRPDVFAGTSLAGLNFSNSFFVSGSREAVSAAKTKLERETILCAMLPIRHGFHSAVIDPIESDFKKHAQGIEVGNFKIPLYSCSVGNRLENPVSGDFSDYLWDVVRKVIDFKGLIASSFETGENQIFIDLSPTGTLSTFLKHGFGKKYEHYHTINQFGKNMESVEKLVDALSATRAA